MGTKTTTKDLRNHLFDMLERVKSINDPDCDEKDKCSFEQAETICEISEQIIESYKVEVQAMHIIAKADNYRTAEMIGKELGLINPELQLKAEN